jgi:hypothetical protein
LVLKDITTLIFIPKNEEEEVEVEEDILVPVLVLTQVIEEVDIDGRKNHVENHQL